jgi:hypothetical protein
VDTIPAIKIDPEMIRPLNRNVLTGAEFELLAVFLENIEAELGRNVKLLELGQVVIGTGENRQGFLFNQFNTRVLRQAG